MVADENQLAAPFDDGDQGAGFRGLGGLVHQHDGELARFEQAMAATDGGRADDLGFVQHAGGHRILHSADFLLIDADVPVHQPLFSPFERGECFA